MKADKPMDTTFECQDGPNIVRKHKINVGFKPMEVENFKCVSNNWANMTCTFKEPFNPIKTSFKVKMGYDSNKQGHLCNITIGKAKDERNIFFGSSTSPYYRRFSRLYHFKLESENQFGRLQENFVIDQMANMKSAPVGLTVTNVTASSARINWKVSEHLHKFPEYLVFHIQLNFENQIGVTVKKVKTSPDPSKGITSNQFQGLMANTNYTVKIRVQSTSTNYIHSNNEEMWSAWRIVKFKTRKFADIAEIGKSNGEVFVETFSNLKSIVNKEIKWDSMTDKLTSLWKMGKN